MENKFKTYNSGIAIERVFCRTVDLLMLIPSCCIKTAAATIVSAVSITIN